MCFHKMYLGPSDSDCCAPLLVSATDVPGLDTDALLTCPLPLAPVEPPRVSSDTALAKLIESFDIWIFEFIFCCSWLVVVVVVRLN